jgi:hypothetical protein
VGSALEFEDNIALVNLEGLENITTVEQRKIRHIDALTRLDGLDGLTEVERVDLDSNDSLCQSVTEAAGASISSVYDNKDGHRPPEELGKFKAPSPGIATALRPAPRGFAGFQSP